MIPFLTILSLILAIGLVVQFRYIQKLQENQALEEKRREAEHAKAVLRLESERFAILNALSEALLLLDQKGTVKFVNTLGKELFRGRDVLGRSIDELFFDDRLCNPIRESLDQESRVTTKVVLPQQASPLGDDDRRGETAWIVDAGPILAKSSQDLTRVIIRDATTEHQTEQVRKDFVANASHELRTPLAIINGYLENLLDEDVLSDRKSAHRFLTIMQKHGQRIARIVEDMLVISRLESGEAGNLNMKPFNLEACVHDVLERLESVINTQGANVEIRGLEKDVVVVGDRFYWTQVLFNLVENTLKQNPEIPLKVEIGWEKTKVGSLSIWVADNGVGIPSSDLPFIFRRFYRVEKHHSQIEIKGTGLGLSIVKRAVEAHGGEIEVRSTPGSDTRFVMTLPESFIVSPTELSAGALEDEDEDNGKLSLSDRKAG